MRERAIYLPLTDREKKALEDAARERETSQRQVLRDAIRELGEKKRALESAPR
jgi:hypothetical protein